MEIVRLLVDEVAGPYEHDMYALRAGNTMASQRFGEKGTLWVPKYALLRHAKWNLVTPAKAGAVINALVKTAPGGRVHEVTLVRVLEGGPAPWYNGENDMRYANDQIISFVEN